jgi:GWxTD domain-containing protein
MLKATFADAQGRHPVSDHFQTVWPDMPLSLRDVEFALDALRYITTEQQLDSLKDGSFETQRDNLEKFWAQRNPDKQSAINPVMTQYYRRVDYAVKNFGTLRDPDGSKTDRGRIYILHGAPARVQRSLDPDRGFKEVWTYTNPEREFVFVDESKSGNYTLVTRKTL